LASGIFPDLWIGFNIVPLFKTGHERYCLLS
jgi:hypothetical protein